MNQKNNHILCTMTTFLLYMYVPALNEALPLQNPRNPQGEKESQKPKQTSIPEDNVDDVEAIKEQLMCDSSVLAGEQSPDSHTVACVRYTNAEVPRNLPFSEHKTYRNQLILRNNGFGDTPSEWRRAARSRSFNIRDIALYILAQENNPRNQEIFLHWVNEPYHHEFSPNHYAQAFSAYGLYNLGDPSGLPLLEWIALSGEASDSNSAYASGLLARLGNSDGLVTIENLFSREFLVFKRVALENLIYFAPLQGQIDSKGNLIDIWHLYHEALSSQDEGLRYTAQLQLREIGTSEALELLRQFSLE